jgi:CheY-like chemotaxis protein/anti-sigma regulatory factor (Ser/Thr protein kinase)
VSTAFSDDTNSPSQQVTALYVEDEQFTQLLVKEFLRGCFKELYTEDNGVNGLSSYQCNHPDIIITDNEMPQMSGIRMIEEIRRSDNKTPIILITGSMDLALLVKAINLGVTYFIAKPIDRLVLLKTVARITGSIVSERLFQKSKEQEIELMHYRERYNTHQQEAAFRKELNIIMNDIGVHSLTLTGPDDEQQTWIAGILYAPLDIMSGDSYSIRKLHDNSIILFVTDAMGKGLAASVTSMLSTSFLNTRIDAAISAAAFDFHDVVGDYLDYIRKILLDEEVLSVAILHIGATCATMDAAIFSMPPVIVHRTDAGVGRIRSNNPPVSKYLNGFNTDRHDLTKVNRILVHSDGLNEAVTTDGALYRSCLDYDFASSCFIKEFGGKFERQVPEPEDDITAIMLERADLNSSEIEEFEIGSRIAEVEQTVTWLENVLASQMGIPAEQVEELSIIAHEALLNAYEHGSMEMSSDLKNTLLYEDNYHDYIREVENRCDRRIRGRIELGAIEDRRIILLRIIDEGKGFNPALYGFRDVSAPLPSGRGLKLLKKYSDALYYNQAGNEITILKVLPGGKHETDPERK